MNKNGWIPVDVLAPDYGEMVLLSFANYPIPQIGELREDDKFYLPDQDAPLRDYGILVNAWQKVPKCYEIS